MKTQTSYKVVIKYGNEFWSYIRNLGVCQYALQYEIGKTTVPEIGKIFVFEKLDDASNFVRYENPRIIIMKGIAKNLTEIEWCSNPYGSFKSFWNKEENFMVEVEAPPGSSVCDSFTPEEVVCSPTE